jgi:hypothetical protein
MRRSVFIRRVVFSLIATLALTASAIAQEQPVLNVSNVEEFYAAVNNPVNAGAIVVLASGTYTLTATDANNQPRPNGGRLVLQSGMALVGQNKYVDRDGDGVWEPRDDNNDGIPDTDPMQGSRLRRSCKRDDHRRYKPFQGHQAPSQAPYASASLDAASRTARRHLRSDRRSADAAGWNRHLGTLPKVEVTKRTMNGI